MPRSLCSQSSEGSSGGATGLWRAASPLQAGGVAIISALVAVASLALAHGVYRVRWVGSSEPPMFAPGEFDLLVAARLLAQGEALPQWAAAVHSNAIGTWLGAWEVVPFLWLGLPDVLALKVVASLHLALLRAQGKRRTPRRMSRP